MQLTDMPVQQGKLEFVWQHQDLVQQILVTGIATAYMDSVPLVAITANVAKSGLGKDSFQEIDIVGATMPITKHNFIVKEIEDLSTYT